MSKLLIIGSTGFIGKHLCLEAKRRNYEIIAGVRAKSDLDFLNKNQIPSFSFTLSDKNILMDELLEFKSKYKSLDFIIYNVGCTQAFNKTDYRTINYQYLRNFIESLQKNNYYPKKLLFTSSLAVHHPIPLCGCAFIKENDELNPVTSYGASKILAEQYLNTIDCFPIVIARPTAVYGAGDQNFLRLIRSIKNHIEIYAVRKKQLLSLIYVEDLVDAYFGLLKKSNTSGPYLISDGKSYSTEKLNSIIKGILKTKTIKMVLPYNTLKLLAWLKENIDKVKGKPGIFNQDKVNDLIAESWVCDTYKLQQEIAFKPKYSLEQAMQKTIKWYQDNELL
ncbi:MAG: NAD(P)-dependent oxidoreductase [Bacteroidales bacterium]|nr:NAD(P)-dependent oxidoreductase [Bacteroidales bacterium]